MSELSDILEATLRKMQNAGKVAVAKPTKWYAADIMSKSLFYKQGSSDKEYHIQVVQEKEGDYEYMVKFQYGRRGGTLIEGVKTNFPVSLEQAKFIYRKVVDEKLGKGYR